MTWKEGKRSTFYLNVSLTIKKKKFLDRNSPGLGTMATRLANTVLLLLNNRVKWQCFNRPSLGLLKALGSLLLSTLSFSFRVTDITKLMTGMSFLQSMCQPAREFTFLKQALIMLGPLF